MKPKFNFFIKLPIAFRLIFLGILFCGYPILVEPSLRTVESFQDVSITSKILMGIGLLFFGILIFKAIKGILTNIK